MLIKHENPNETIKTERSNARRRQVVCVLLCEESTGAVCLYRPKAAELDGRCNWIPVQGGVNEDETLFRAAAREVAEELGIYMSEDAHYLGSAVRTCDPLRKGFHEAHCHWVLGFVQGFTLTPESAIAEAKWCYPDGILNWTLDNMSSEKAGMFSAALKAAVSGLLGSYPAWQAQEAALAAQAA